MKRLIKTTKTELIPVEINNNKYKRQLAELGELLYEYICQHRSVGSSPLSKNSTNKGSTQ